MLRNKKSTVLRLALIFSLLVAITGCTSFNPFTMSSPTARTSTRVIPTTVKRDCSRDVTAQLNYALAVAPRNSTLKFPSNGCYRIDGTLNINFKHGLTIDGGNSTFKAMTDGRALPPREARMRDQFLIQNSSNITIKNAIVRGANPHAGMSDDAYVAALEAQQGFEISSSSYVMLNHVQAYDVYGDFVYIGGAGVPSRHVVVANSRFSGNGRIGMSVTNATDVWIAHNSMDQMRRSVFDLEPYASNWVIQRVTMQDNTIGAARLNFFSSYGRCAVVDHIAVLGNHLYNQEMNGEIVNSEDGCHIRRKYFTFSGNTSDKEFGTPSGMALKFVGVDGIVLTNNVQPLQPARNMHLARLTDSAFASVTGNVLAGGAGSIFTIDGSTLFCYSNNRIGRPLRLELSLRRCT